ncbi:MAG: DNA helicase RecQ [Pseudomonadota bacterium]
MIDKAKNTLKNVFGYDEFRPLQEKIIRNVLERKDALAIMPTGSGKSLCYQIPAIIFDGLTIVISPLISLMKDQVEALNQVGVEAVVLNSSLSYDEYCHNVFRIKNNQIKLLYLAPETLLKPQILEMISGCKVDFLAIDEAHCISEWGHDFRPEYRQLSEVRKKLKDTTCIALTATATLPVREDIKVSLNFSENNEFISSFNRENLFLQILPKYDPLEQILEFLEKYKNQSGIIYCFSRKQVDSLYESLLEHGFSVKPYHAGLDDNVRRKNQELFIKDDVQIIVATIAFGMGINKPNVRFVIHHDLPKNIETYYQEIGRAGRDGINSHCLLLFSYSDTQKIKYFINQKEDLEKRRIANIHLNSLLGFAETSVCRRIPMLSYFGETFDAENCEMCDNCVSEPKPLVDISLPAKKFLSCVKRTGELFGTHHIIDVLRGSQSQKISKFQHNLLSTYAIGKEYSKKQWFHLSRQFIQQDFVCQDLNHGSLILTKKAYELFKGKISVLGILLEDKQKHEVKKEPPIKKRKKTKMEVLDYDKDLFEILRKIRKEKADQTNVPPYVIFPDTTLIEFSSYFPKSKESMINMNGVGQIKLEKYSQLFLDPIIEYCEKNNIDENEKGSTY